MNFTRIGRRALLAMLATAALVSAAVAQNYPNRAIKLMVPTGPGGSYDIVGRLVGDQLSKRLNQPVIIENRAGAGTVVGTQAAMAAAPDGYTLLVGGLSNIVFNSSLYTKQPYDAKELIPIAIVYRFPYILVGSPTLSHATVKDIIAAAKQKPNSLNLAHAGLGSGQHLTAVAFMKYTGAQMLEVPFRSSSAVYPDLMSGRVDLFFDSSAAALPYIKSGKLKAYAVLSAKRQNAAPDVPTMTEMGVANLEIDSWIGIFALAKTPPAVIETLRKEINASLPELQGPFEKIGGDVLQVPAPEVDAFVKRESDKWTTIIKEAHITLD